MSSGVSINQSGTAINSVSEVWLFIVCGQSSIPDNHSCFNLSKPNTCVLEEGVNQDLLTFWNFKSWRLYAELYSRKATALYFGILYVYSFWFQFIVNSFAKFLRAATSCCMAVRFCVLTVVFVDCLFLCLLIWGTVYIVGWKYCCSPWRHAAAIVTVSSIYEESCNLFRQTRVSF